MRCPSCGTDNAPDSRFCGGCGARFAAPDPRVAPTQKISDDVPIPERRRTPAAAPITAPGVATRRAVPPTPYVPHGMAPVAPSAQPLRAIHSPPAGSPPAGSPPAAPVHPVGAPPQPPIGAARGAFPGVELAARDPAWASPPPAAPSPDDPSPSLSIPARRPWRLILVVLLIDIGLAAAGAWMLYQGLGGGAGGAASSEPSSPRSR